eukprot:1793739-Amphidinium_carterae.1
MRPNFDSLQSLREALATGKGNDATSHLPQLVATSAPQAVAEQPVGTISHAQLLDRLGNIAFIAKQSAMMWFRKEPALASAMVTLLVLTCLWIGWFFWWRCSCRRQDCSEGHHRRQLKDWLTPAPSPSSIMSDRAQELVVTLPSNTHGAWEAEAKLQPMQAEPVR